MSKEQRTVTLDPDLDEYLSQPSVNASALVNSLLRQYVENGGEFGTIREFRLQQLESEYEDLANRARRKLEEYNELQASPDPSEETTVDDGRRADILDKVRMVPRDESHPVVQDAAEELGLGPSEVLAEAYGR